MLETTDPFGLTELDPFEFTRPHPFGFFLLNITTGELRK